ncbi:hypothetical protein BBJ28_00015657 [Nothophytophthora sp. Chile5]|nr:hypothetical protein BBJ28_00015657 [Nothophytophthora sp. Chile5]
MAITADVKNQLFKPSSSCSGGGQLIRLPSEAAPAAASSPCSSSDGEKASPSSTNGRAWTADEHNRFLEGLELFPSGPWKEIAAHVGSRTTRQTMTHAQKYREKIARRKRGLRASSQARSLRRLRDQQKQKQAESPCSVADQKLALPPAVLVAQQDAQDPLDIRGCFAMTQTQLQAQAYQFHGMMMRAEHSLATAMDYTTLLSDFDPLPMSEEEIDLILEAAMLPTPAYGQSGFVL